MIALTEWEADWYRQRGVANVHVTGVGPNVLTLPRIAREPAMVLFVGRKERYKGITHCATRHASSGANDRTSDSSRSASRPGTPASHRGRRILAGRISASSARTRRRRRTRGASIFAMPSDHETFGHTYLEAWMAGLPVIAGDIAPLREVVREGVDGLHARNEPRSIAAAILALLRDPDRARRMGESGRERVLRDFTWAAVAKRTRRPTESAVTAARLRARM